MVASALLNLAQDGGSYALLAVCLIVVYRTTGVPNFALAAIGTTGTYLYSYLAMSGTNRALAAVVAMLLGAAASIVCGFIYTRWFFDASPAYRTAVAIGLFVATVAITILIFSDVPREIPILITGTAFTIGGAVVTNTDLFALVLAVAVTLFVTMMLQRSRRGLQLRAISQGPVAAELLGIPVKPLGLFVWGVSGALASIAVILIAPGQTAEIESISLTIVPALAITLVAGFRRYWIALVAAVVLAALQGLLLSSQDLIRYEQVIPFLVILAVLVWNQRREVWDEAR